MNIKKAVITAGGRGTRFLPLSKAYQKEMVAIMNKPQLQCVIEEAIDSGITDIAVVVREGVETFIEYLEEDEILMEFLKENGKEEYMDSWKRIKDSCDITVLTQKESDPYGNGTPFMLAEEFVGDDSFVAMFGDDIMIHTDRSQPTALAQIIEAFKRYEPTAVMSVKKVALENVNRYGICEYLEESDSDIPYQTSGFVEKPEPENAPSQYANAARYVLSPTVVKELNKNIKGKDGELWLTDAISRLIDSGHKVMAMPWKGSRWTPVGDPVRWLRGNLITALNDDKYRNEVLEILRKEGFVKKVR
jgi:UTP--glucose-1-phosphate uridylyltransferase